MKIDLPAIKQKISAFTLVEVLLAVTLIAAVAIPIVMLVPIGTGELSDVIDQSIQTEIVRKIGGELAMSDWIETNELAAWNERELWFDGEGTAIDEGANAIYTARVQVQSPQSFPGNSTSNQFLRPVQILVTNAPPGVTNRFSDPTRHRLQTILVSRMDK